MNRDSGPGSKCIENESLGLTVKDIKTCIFAEAALRSGSQCLKREIQFPGSKEGNCLHSHRYYPHQRGTEKAFPSIDF